MRDDERIGAVVFSITPDLMVEQAKELLDWAREHRIRHLQMLPVEVERAKELGGLFRKSGVRPMVLFCTFGEECPCRDADAAFAQVKVAIDCGKALAGDDDDSIIVASPSYLRALGDPERGLPGEEDEGKQVVFLKMVDEYVVDDDKVVVAVETINRFESRGPNDPRDLLRLFELAGVLGKFKILYDTFHAWMLGGDGMSRILLDVAEHVAMVHASQPSRTWIHEGTAIDRGTIRLLKHHPALKDVPIVMEAFSRQSPADFFHLLACNELPNVPTQMVFEAGANWLEMQLDAA